MNRRHWAFALLLMLVATGAWSQTSAVAVEVPIGYVNPDDDAATGVVFGFAGSGSILELGACVGLRFLL